MPIAKAINLNVMTRRIAKQQGSLLYFPIFYIFCFSTISYLLLVNMLLFIIYPLQHIYAFALGNTT